MEANELQENDIKETFIIRTEWWDWISQLSEKDKAILLEWLFLYHLKKPIENINDENNLVVKMCWSFITPNLKRNIENYDKRCETSKVNGKKGGRPITTNNLNNLKEPKESLSDSDTDSDTDTEIEYENESENFKNLSHFDYLDFHFKKELLEVVAEYKPKINDWDFCVEKFNNWKYKDPITIIDFKKWVKSEYDPKSKTSINSEPHKTTDKPKEKIGGI